MQLNSSWSTEVEDSVILKTTFSYFSLFFFSRKSHKKIQNFSVLANRKMFNKNDKNAITIDSTGGRGPASINNTLNDGVSLNRLASTPPPAPEPITIKWKIKFHVRKKLWKFPVFKVKKKNDRQFLTDKVEIQRIYILIGIKTRRILRKCFWKNLRGHIFSWVHQSSKRTMFNLKHFLEIIIISYRHWMMRNFHNFLENFLGSRWNIWPRKWCWSM